MDRYRNLGNNSGVGAYEIDLESIKVKFTTGAVCLYNYTSTGAPQVERMKILALKGVGLNSYIGRVARKKYAARLR